MLLLGAGFVLMGHILSGTRLILFVPLSTAFMFLLTLGYSFLFQHEAIQWYTWTGMLLIIVGVVMITFMRS